MPPSEGSASSSATQPTCATRMVTMYVTHAGRYSGLWCAARAHWSTIPIRMTT
jgi:hypothetical protein